MPDANDLDKLKADLKKTQDDIAGLNQKASGIQADIKTLEAKLAEIEKATDGYDKSSADMQRELDDDEKAIGRKRTIAECAIKELKDLIDKKILDFDGALENRGNAVKTADDKATQAAAAADNAIKDWQAKQSAYATLKNQPKTLAAKLKDLKALVDEIAKAEMQDDPVAMYFYVSEAAALAKGISVPPPADYTKQLIAQQAATEAATTIAEAKKADSDTAATAAADAKKTFDAALSSRRADLLKVLHDVKAPVPA
jgi:DNA repair exonuclease SbcCD ATPase subunit